MNISTTGWNDLLAVQPIDPRNIIANVTLGGTQGVYKRSTTCLQASWGTNSVAYTGNNTTMVSLNPTDAASMAWAAQWVVQTKMVDVAASINPAVNKLAFTKAGPYWGNNIEIGFGATNYTDLQLTFRDNLATTGVFAGSASGAVPVFSFAGTHTGNELLVVTFPHPGTYSLVLVMNNAGTYSVFEMEIVAL
jgi:hypothetical protein